MPARRRPALAAVTTLAALTTLLAAPLALAGSAQAAPPVTGPDDLGTTYPRNAILVNPLDDDTDPDGDALSLCGVGTEHYRGVHAELDEFTPLVRIGTRALPGTYTFGYEACAGGERTPGTVTVTVATPPEVTITAVRHRPGFVRLRNPADFAVKASYGAYRTDDPDGTVKVRAGASRLVRVRRDRIEIRVYDRTGDTFIGQARVSGIRLPATR